MIEKLHRITEVNDSIFLKNNLYNEFENSIKKTHNLYLTCNKQNSISDYIHKSIKHTITEIVHGILNSNSLLFQSENIVEITKSIQKILHDSNLGTFEYEQKSGKNFFRVKHSEGSNGTEFLKLFFKEIFKRCLKNYSFHIIYNESYVCVIFR